MLQNKRAQTVLTAIILVLFIIFLFVRPTNKKIVLPNNQIIKIEVADSALKRAKGLMYRKHLDENTGMLFIFDDQVKHIFWMKNTLIPLDMIWMNENFKIVDITGDVQPCTTTSCQTYMPASPAKYVLEVNGGYSKKQSIKIGDTLQLK